MELKEKLPNSCPKCSCNIVIQETIETEYGRDYNDSGKIRVHCNGHRWESRKFLCGCIVQFIPNFMTHEVKGQCINDLVYKEKVLKRKELKKQIRVLEEEVSKTYKD